MPERKKNATNATKATDASHPLPPSPPSHEGFIPPHGGYEKLFSYPKTQIIYDATIRFCDRFISIKSRTHDQMVQAARSGNKNIAEGSQVSGTSKETEIKLTNVARASLEELLGDYQDYLRQHRHKLWDKNSKEALYVRKLGKKDNLVLRGFSRIHRNPPAGNRGQHSDLPDSPGQLSARPATPPAGTGFPERRRPARAHDPRPPRRPREAKPGRPASWLTGSKMRPMQPRRPMPIRRLGRVRRLRQADGWRPPPPGHPRPAGKEAGSERVA